MSARLVIDDFLGCGYREGCLPQADSTLNDGKRSDRPTEWQSHLKARSCFSGVYNHQRPTVPDRNVAGDGKPEPAATGAGGSRQVETTEPLENLLYAGERYTRPIVLDRQACESVTLL